MGAHCPITCVFKYSSWLCRALDLARSRVNYRCRTAVCPRSSTGDNTDDHRVVWPACFSGEWFPVFIVPSLMFDWHVACFSFSKCCFLVFILIMHFWLLNLWFPDQNVSNPTILMHVIILPGFTMFTEIVTLFEIMHSLLHWFLSMIFQTV